MKPHLNHIAQTLARKQAADKAQETSYQTYIAKVAKLSEEGYNKYELIMELEGERERIKKDRREGDPLFQKGLQNAKQSCLDAIELIIAELKEVKGDK